MPKQIRTMLTIKKVETLPPGIYCDGGNLYLQVRANARSWIFRYTPPGGGKQRHMGLGPAPLRTLAEARDLAHQLRRQITVDKIDPLEERRGKHAEVQQQKPEYPRVPTFAECAKACLIARQEGTSATYRRASAQQLKQYVYPALGERRVNTITRNHVLEVLRPIWTTKHVTAGRVQTLLSSVFKFAVFKGYRADDPAQWKNGLDNVLARPMAVHKVKHREALGVNGTPAFMAGLRAQSGTVYRAVEFTLLTAARSDMTRLAEWHEIDMAAAVWTIPKDKMKARRDFRIPLSTRAMAIIEVMAAIRRTGYVFPGGYGDRMNSGAQLFAIKLVSGDDKLTVHGLRSTFATWAQAQGIEAERLAQLSLDHRVHTATEAAYARSDLLEERRKLMQAWDDYCSSSR